MHPAANGICVAIAHLSSQSFSKRLSGLNNICCSLACKLSYSCHHQVAQFCAPEASSTPSRLFTWIQVSSYSFGTDAPCQDSPSAGLFSRFCRICKAHPQVVEQMWFLIQESLKLLQGVSAASSISCEPPVTADLTRLLPSCQHIAGY